MKFCKRCLYREIHPLNLVLDEEGICSGCRVHEEKDILDWKTKASELELLLKQYQNLSGNNYDCIIPVSGARDSHFIVHLIKNVYKMNPLLVTYNKQYNTDVGARNLANLRIKFDCDILTLTVDPEKVKKITRATLRKMGSIYWHCIAGQTVFPVQIAVKFKIPLIIWGAHQGVDQVGMFSHLDQVEMTRKYRKEHDLMGYEAHDLIDPFDEVDEADIISYVYPSDEEIAKVGVRGIYLNHYIRWDSKAQHEQMIALYNYESAEQTRTFDTYNDVDCFNYSDVHDYLKWIKHGYGKVVDHVCREIRLRRMTREQGKELILKYVPRASQNLKHFLNWIGMTENGFHYIVDQHRNPLFWKRNTHWEWVFIENLIPQFEQEDEINLARLKPFESNCRFLLTPRGVSTDRVHEYLLMGRGR
jgi:N-acetyl sugar amidotransferase